MIATSNIAKGVGAGLGEGEAKEFLASRSGSLLGEVHLRDLLADEKRCERMVAENDGVVVDFSRQRMTTEVLDGLLQLWQVCEGPKKVKAMQTGVAINTTEGRSVLHHALRAARGTSIIDSDGKDAVAEVWAVLDSIKAFR